MNDTPIDIKLDITRSTISAAARRIQADVRRTPTWRLPGAAWGLPCAELWLKLEHLQLGGSFKARGMFNRMRSLPIPAAGVVIASGGNAGIAVACAARAMGVPCEVFLPDRLLAPPSGRRWLRSRPPWWWPARPTPTRWPPAWCASKPPARC